MKVSVALCTYNGEAFLGEQLASLAAQERHPDELVVFDDRSSDSTMDKLAGFSAGAPFPVRIERNDSNVGSTRNFERAIRRCRGDIIFLCDQDDVWMPGKIRRITEIFESQPNVGMVFTNAELVDPDLRAIGLELWDRTFPADERAYLDQGSLAKLLIDHNVVTGATMAFRAELRDAFCPIPAEVPNMIHDHWIALNAAALSEIVFIDENLISYRQHAGQQLGVDLGSGKLTAESDKESQYLRWIAYLEKEIDRLRHMMELGNRFDHLQMTFGKADIESIIDEKRLHIKHLRNRLLMPKARLRRLVPVAGELLTGRYGRYSRGILSALKDLGEQSPK